MTLCRNVLFIMADEHQAAALSYLDHPVLKSPNLDRLAARGTLFENAYTPCPICVPARAAVATGRPVHQTGYWDNALAYDGRIRSWGHVMHDAGVEAVSIGKLHYRNAQDPTGFDEQIVPMHIKDGIGMVWGSIRNPLPDRPKPGMNMLGGVGPGFSSYNAYDAKVAEEAVAWLGARDQNPWSAFVSFVAPHFPLIAPQEYIDLYPPEEMPLAPVRPANGHPSHPWVTRQCVIEDSEKDLGSEEARREAVSGYYALCTYVDALIGKVLDVLEASGQAEDTLIVYTSDHGEQLGMRDRWGKSTLYRESTQVPLIIAGPGVEAGARVATPVDLLDIRPTMTDALGVAPDPDWTGTSLLEVMSRPDDPDRAIFSEYHAAMSDGAGLMLTTARCKLHRYAKYEDELFDLEADPLETNNLAADPAHRAKYEEMCARLAEICDLDAVNVAALADQDRLIAGYGGPQKTFDVGTPAATPPPAV